MLSNVTVLNGIREGSFRVRGLTHSPEGRGSEVVFAFAGNSLELENAERCATIELEEEEDADLFALDTVFVGVRKRFPVREMEDGSRWAESLARFCGGGTCAGSSEGRERLRR